MKKKLIGLLVAVLAFGGGYYTYSSYSQKQAEIKAEEEKKKDQERQEQVEQTIEETKEDLVDYTEQKEEQGLQVEIQDSYEKWLASTMVIGISMYYMDYEIQNIYLDDTTLLDDHMASRGAYVSFIGDGEELMIHSVPLEAERTEAGTIDLGSQNIGYATFEIVENVDTSEMKEVTLDELTDLINQCLLVTVYEN